MDQIIAKKEPVSTPQLKMKVFHESIYGGRELMTVVGIREKEVELRGYYSGGTHPPYVGVGSDWHPIDGLFRLRKICDQHFEYTTCQLPNVHCGYPTCEPYLSNWGHYIDGILVDEVAIKE